MTTEKDRNNAPPDGYPAWIARNSAWLLLLLVVFGWLSFLVFSLSTDVTWTPPRALTLPDSSHAGDLELRGQLGDSFGAFNALVSAVALVGVITTLRLQHNQLAAQDSQFSRLHFSEQLRFAISSYESCLNSVTARSSRDGAREDDGTNRTVRDEKEYDVTGRAALAEIWHRDIIFELDLRDPKLKSMDDARVLQLEIARQSRPPTLRQRETLRTKIESVVRDLNTNDDAGRKAAATKVVRDAWRLAMYKHKHQFSPLSESARAVLRLIDASSGIGIDDANRKLQTEHFRARLSETEMYFLLAASYDYQSGSPRDENVFTKLGFFDSVPKDADIAVALLLSVHNTV